MKFCVKEGNLWRAPSALYVWHLCLFFLSMWLSVNVKNAKITNNKHLTSQMICVEWVHVCVHFKLTLYKWMSMERIQLKVRRANSNEFHNSSLNFKLKWSFASRAKHFFVIRSWVFSRWFEFISQNQKLQFDYVIGPKHFHHHISLSATTRITRHQKSLFRIRFLKMCVYIWVCEC